MKSSSTNNNSNLKIKLQFYLVNCVKLLNENNPSHLNDNDVTLEKFNHLLGVIEYILGLNRNQSDIKEELLTRFPVDSIDSIRSELTTTNLYSLCLNQLLSKLNLTKCLITNKQRYSSQQFELFKKSIITIIKTTNFTDSFNVIYDLCTTLK
jgi:hypothetical protein